MEHAVRTQAAPRGLHVLLVDDDVCLLEVMFELLRHIGITSVQVAGSVMEALAIYVKTRPPPNLVVFDLFMP